MSDSKKNSMECNQPKNNARVDADPLISEQIAQVQSEGLDNPVHSAAEIEILHAPRTVSSALFLCHFDIYVVK